MTAELRNGRLSPVPHLPCDKCAVRRNNNLIDLSVFRQNYGVLTTRLAAREQIYGFKRKGI
jgi:hypothetical protein